MFGRFIKATDSPAPKAPGNQYGHGTNDNSNLTNMLPRGPIIPMPPVKAPKSDVVILKLKSIGLNTDDIDKLEERYSAKFGRKVIILESILELVNG